MSFFPFYPYPSTSFGGVVEDAQAAFVAADKQWRATFEQANAAAAKGDETTRFALAQQAAAEFDRSVQLKKVLDDVSSPPPAPGHVTSTVTLFTLWRTSLRDAQIAAATNQAPKIVAGLRTIADQAQAAYFAATPSLYRRWWDLNDAWSNAIHSNATPGEIAELKTESEAALSAFLKMPLADRWKDLNGAWLAASRDPGSPPALVAELRQQSEAALANLASPTKRAKDEAAARAPTPGTVTPTSGLVSAAIVTSPLWLFALLKRFVL